MTRNDNSVKLICNLEGGETVVYKVSSSVFKKKGKKKVFQELKKDLRFMGKSVESIQRKK